MRASAPVHVTVHVWQVPVRRIPTAALRMATDRLRLRRLPGLRFAKLVGTGDGTAFTARDADPCHWALLAAWGDRDYADEFDRSAVARGWRSLATAVWRVDLLPLAARGRWARREPFGQPDAVRWDGAVAALTRARIAPRKAMTFWRAVPPVSAALHGRPGLRAAIGIGEAPLGFQGTFSVWESAAALRAFAYESVEHREVIRRTASEGWYAEELFARFGVLGSSGTLFGKEP